MLEKNPDLFPEKAAHFLIDGPAGLLELKANSAPVPMGNAIAVIAHPNPQQQGTMDNKVVTMLAKAFLAKGIHTIRFNFRGVGLSEGSFGDTIGEMSDLETVIKWGQTTLNHPTLYLAGFSFGSYIAASVSHHFDVKQLITVAPPVHYLNFDLLHVNCPWTTVVAHDDEIVPLADLDAFLHSHPEITRIDMPETSHFFHGRLVDLREHLIKTIIV